MDERIKELHVGERYYVSGGFTIVITRVDECYPGYIGGWGFLDGDPFGHEEREVGCAIGSDRLYLQDN